MRRSAAILSVCDGTIDGQEPWPRAMGRQPDKTLVGPNLFDVVGRHSGSEPGFGDSAAKRAADLVRDEATLDRCISARQKVVPGTITPYPELADAARRADPIACRAR